jgi:hypothetical protein
MKINKLIAVLAIFVGFQASANVIEIELDKTQVGPNEILNVNLVANFTDPVDEFDFDFLFDTSVFSFVDGSASTDLPNDGFDTIFSIAANPTGVGMGFIDFVGGFLDGEYFINFDLMADAAGDSSFDLAVNKLYSFYEDQDYQLAAVEQKSATVSAPATLGLFVIALIAFAGFRRKA